jgi:hypothetical protein
MATQWGAVGQDNSPFSQIASVMKPCLQEVHTVVADEIDQPVFASDSPRPDTRANLLEVLGLSNPGERISHHRLDQINNPERCLPVGINPPTQVLEALGLDHQRSRLAPWTAPLT